MENNKNWWAYEGMDFCDESPDGSIHILGCVYHSDDNGEGKEWRILEYCFAFTTRQEWDSMGDEEREIFLSETKQYIGDITEEEAKDIIESYLKNSTLL